jgi:hypothetical protein
MSTASMEGLKLTPAKPAALTKISRLALTASVAFVSIPALIFFFFAVPAWDDLIAATGPRHMGLWQYVIGRIYFHWEGRWASCGLESVTLPHLDLTRYYAVLILCVAAVNIVGAYVLCRWFTPAASKKASAAVAACLLAILWTSMPSLAEAVYWYVGSVENSMSLALAAMLVVAVIQLSKSARRNLPVIVLLCAAAIFICGIHELYGSMLCAALMTGTLWSILTRKANRSVWIAVTIAAAIGLAIVVKAPGNAHRLASDGGKYSRHIAYDLRLALSQARHSLPRWALNPKLLAASVWVAFSPMLRSQPRKPTSICLWHWLLPAAWLAMLAVGFFAPSWAFGKAMPARTLSGIYIIFVIGWLINIFVWTANIAWSSEKIASIACLVLAISLLTIGNAVAAVSDLRTRVRPWHTAVENRFATLRNAAGADALVPQLPKPSPRILLDGEVVNDPGDYRNWSTVIYFKLRSLRLIPHPSEGPIPPPPLHPTLQPGTSGQ